MTKKKDTWELDQNPILKVKLKFWDKYLLRNYSARILILAKQINTLYRFIDQSKSEMNKLIFSQEIIKLQKEFQKYEEKCRLIEDKYFFKEKK